MEQITNDDLDYFLIQIKKKLRREQGKAREKSHGLVLVKRNLDLGFRILLPQEFGTADEQTTARIFWSERCPTNFLVNEKRDAGFTFQMLEESGKKMLDENREEIHRILEQIDERIVFYEQGEEKNILWFDYKSFAGNEVIYNIIFLFHAGAGKVLGSFFCPFEEYDRWKWVVLEMLNTIEKE